MPPDQLRLLAPTWRDAVEILLVAFVLYRLLRFLAGTRALQIVFGLLVLLAGWLAASLLKFTMVTYLLSALRGSIRRLAGPIARPESHVLLAWHAAGGVSGDRASYRVAVASRPPYGAADRTPDAASWP